MYSERSSGGTTNGRYPSCNNIVFIARRAIRPFPSSKGCMFTSFKWTLIANSTGWSFLRYSLIQHSNASIKTGTVSALGNTKGVPVTKICFFLYTPAIPFSTPPSSKACISRILSFVRTCSWSKENIASYAFAWPVIANASRRGFPPTVRPSSRRIFVSDSV